MFKDKLTVQYDDLKQYEQEDEIVALDFLDRYFYKRWKYDLDPGPVKPGLELIISPYCNQACKYCYWVKYQKGIFPDAIYNIEKTKENLLLILKWLDHNQFNPSFDIFSGEIFAQQIGFDCLNIIYEYEKNVDPRWRVPSVMIPTNFSWVTNEKLYKQVEELQHKFESININFTLSASFDGYYEEVNRPFSNKLDLEINKPILNDEYYNKLFEAASTLSTGLHPMVYSEHMDKWIDNFLWFQDMMEKYNIPWDNLYLLEVRNDNWDVNSIHEMQKFLEFLYEWLNNKFEGDTDCLYNFIIKNGFNILNEPIGRISRGMPCSIQSEFFIRLSDLKMYPCHRLGYEQFHYGTWEPTNDESVLKFIPENVSMMLTIYGLHHRCLNYCVECPINHLCIGPCLGSNYESNHNFMTPSPTVCALKHAMAETTVKMLMKYNIYYRVLTIVSPPQKVQFEWIRKEIQAND